MGTTVNRLYRRVDEHMEYCFNVETVAPLTDSEREHLKLVLSDGFLIKSVSEEPYLTGERVVEVGPRMNFATAWSSNMVSICRAIGIDKVTRVERSRRFSVPAGEDMQQFIADNHDRMTECPYPEPLSTFETGVVPEAVYDVDLKGGGTGRPARYSGYFHG